MSRRLPVLDETTQAGVSSLANLLPQPGGDGAASLGEYAIEYLKASKTPDHKALQAAAGRLGIVDAEAFESSLLALSNFYFSAAKARLQEKELSRAMTQFTSLTDEIKQQLVQVYVNGRKDLLRLIGRLRGSLPHYHDLDWRIDVELSRRSLLHEPRPLYLLRLDTTTPGATQDDDGHDEGEDEAAAAPPPPPPTTSYHLQADYANLKNLLVSLDAAVSEVNSTHCQRFARYIR